MTLVCYRAEIDGLRALAVIPVILFHAGFSSFSGGFVGVDVFFVISGYLITSIIVLELQQGKFSVLNFYERRARRILPALFCVLASCLPFAWLILYPHDLKEFSDSLIAVAAFASNIYFWRNSSYFDTASELRPLLHTWSLAVEEQYYTIVPIILIMAWRFGRRWIGLGLAVAVMSLLMAQWGSHNAPSLTFYLLPTRFWELLLGAAVAYYFTSVRPREEINPTFRQVGSAIGLCCIVYSIVFFDKQTPFPSFYTLIPTVGAALIIFYANNQTLVGQLLSNKLMVGIGLISYSAYLWHQPLFAFTRQYYLEEPSLLLFALLSLISMGLAYWSWKFVELPLRHSRYSRKIVFVASMAGLVFFGSAGLALPHLKKSTPLTAEEQEVYSFVAYDFASKARRSRCFLDSATQPPSTFAGECKDGSIDGPRVLVWGDSHAAALSIGIRALHPNALQYTSDNCPPIYGRNYVTAKYCGDTNRYVVEEIRRVQPELVFIDAYWHAYYSGGRLSLLSDTVATIKQVAPNTKVVIVGNVPLWTGGLPRFMLKHGMSLHGDVTLRLPHYEELKRIDGYLRSVADESGAIFVSALDAFCKDAACRVIVPLNGSPSLATYDYGHLTEAGSIHLASYVLSSVNGNQVRP